MWVEPKAFTEFFPVSEAQALQELGSSGYRTGDVEGARKFAEGLDRLLADPLPNPPLRSTDSVGGWAPA